MNADDYQKLKDIFNSALDLPPEDRSAFLAERCSGNEEMRGRVERLLDSNDSTFLESPAGDPFSETSSNNCSRSGQRIGHYEVIRRIGSGGMGDVYLAVDGKLGRQVAIKILPDEFTSDESRLDRFQLEARSASSLSHPNILTIFEIGEWEGTHYIATEYVEGETLRQRLSRERLSIGESMDLGIQLTSAIAAAHEAAICHRDIKPENIMIRRDGLLKVVDFGLAKLVASPFRSSFSPTLNDEPTVKIVNTEPGVIMGTVQYMSPEQTRALPTDERSDIWSLGCVLYEMLTGHSPFAGETSADMVAEIVKTHPELPSRIATDVPERLDEIISKSLEKHPDERYQTAKDLLIDLKRLKRNLELEDTLERSNPSMRTDPVTAVTSGPNIISTKKGPKDLTEVNSAEYLYWGIKAHRWTAIGITLFIIGLVGGTAMLVRYYWSRPMRRGSHMPLRSNSRLRLLTPQTWPQRSNSWRKRRRGPAAEICRGFEWGYLSRLHSEMSANQPSIIRFSSVDSVAFSPDGQRLAAGGTANEVKVWDLATESELLQLSGHSGWIVSVAFSPDGDKIATGSFDRSAKIWDAKSGKELLTIKGETADGAIGFLSFLKDGRTLVGADGETIRSWDANTGVALKDRSFTKNAEPPFAMSPDQKLLSARTRDDDRTAAVWDIATGRELARLRGHNGLVHDMEFSPDSKTILTASADRSAKLWDPKSGDVLHTFRGHGDEVRDVSFVPDGKMAVTGSNDDTVRLWDLRSGYDVATFRGHRGDVQALSVSPSGRKLASGGGTYDDTIRIWNVPSSEPPGVLRGHSGEVKATDFSPDGGLIASASADKTAVLWDTRKKSRERFILTGHAGGVNSVSFAPDGQTLATSSQDGKVRQWNTTNGKQFQIFDTLKKGPAATFSPDGKLLAVTHFLNHSEVELWDAASGQKRCSFDVGDGGAWRVDFSKNGTQVMASGSHSTIRVRSIDTCSEHWSFEGEVGREYAGIFRPDGKVLAIEILNEGRSLRLIDTGSRKEISSIAGHEASVNSVELSPDGRRLLTTGADSTLRLWEVTTGQELLSVPISGGLSGAVFSPDGGTLVVAGNDGAVRLLRSDPY